MNIDLSPNESANRNALVNGDQNPDQYINSLKKIIEDNSKSTQFDAVMCTAGNFAMTKITDVNFFKSYEQMHKVNVNPTLLTAHLASSYLKKDGLCVITGAEFPFKSPAPDMLCYALSKNLVHSLANNVAKSGHLPENSSLVTILPYSFFIVKN